MIQIPTTVAATALLSFLRISAVMFSLPVYGDASTPIRTRVMCSVALTLALFTMIPTSYVSGLDFSLMGMGLAALSEILLGLSIGFVARMLFDGLVAAAGLLGYQMGFGTANLFIPDAGMQMDSFSALHRMLMFLIFFSLNLHHLFFAAMARSFTLIKAGEFAVSPQFAEAIVLQSEVIFVTALQVGAPVLVSLLFSTAALGLMARAVPQLNVFSLSFPIGFATGLLIYIATLPFFPATLDRYGTQLQETLNQILLR